MLSYLTLMILIVIMIVGIGALVMGMLNKETMMMLPDREKVAAQVHAAWMEMKQKQGITSRFSEWGEELMVPYARLSERAKDLDRATVQTVYDAIVKAIDS